MKNPFQSRAIHLPALLIASLLLSGQALACLSPSMMEMRESRSMACCAEHCRFETTEQAAQKACEQSRQGLTQHEVLSSPSASPLLETVKSLPDSGLFLPVDFTACNLIHSTLQIKKHDHSKRFISVNIYTFVRSFLI